MNDEIERMARKAAGGMLTFNAEGDWRLSSAEVERFFWLAYKAGADDARNAAGVCDGFVVNQMWE
jgi:hypothetical protein